MAAVKTAIEGDHFLIRRKIEITEVLTVAGTTPDVMIVDLRDMRPDGQFWLKLEGITFAAGCDGTVVSIKPLGRNAAGTLVETENCAGVTVLDPYNHATINQVSVWYLNQLFSDSGDENDFIGGDGFEVILTGDDGADDGTVKATILVT